MISKTDKLIITELRNNARMALADISRNTGIPVSTIFDKLKKLEERCVHKHTSLIDFSKVNYNMIVNFVLRVEEKEREKVRSFLLKHNNINNVFRLNSGYDFLVEGVFRDMKQIEDFNEEIMKFKIVSKKDFHVIEELKKEEFLSEKEHFDL